MSFIWQDLINIADQLIEQDPKSVDEEAYFRSAVNRSYYGAYKSVTHWLEQSHQYTEPTEHAHSAVLDKLSELDDSRLGNRIKHQLNSLRGLRVDADYEYAPINGNFDERKAKIAVEQARQICSMIP